MITSYNPFTLENKKILVIGASSGIGKATAIECSRMGAEVIISGRNEIRLNETLKGMAGDSHQILKADILKDEDVKNLVNKIPPLDGLVLCSGLSMTVPTLFSTREKFDKIFNTNFFANVEVSRLIIKNKKIKNGGSIVVLSSAGGTYGFDPGNSIYGASKAALATWMKILALEIAPKSIRVNSICPSMVNTPMALPGIISDEQLQKHKLNYPLRRFGEPEEVAYACVYFLSDATKWITGTNFLIDGGLTIK